MTVARVLLDVPGIRTFDYRVPSEIMLKAGQLCVVPLGRRRAIGVVAQVAEGSELPRSRLREIERILDVEPLSDAWLALTEFAADYYHHGWGEAAASALPNLLRRATGPRAVATVARRWQQARSAAVVSEATCVSERPLTDEQRSAVSAINAAAGFHSFVLFGITGSGKTEVYLEAMASRLAADRSAQALLLVPEIGLTPQLEARVVQRFGRESIVVLHSGLAEGTRANGWLAALAGARIVVGTRSAVFAPMPGLAIVCVDEEHDPSYKANDGIRYSARDLALKRAQISGVPIVLGSATPSLESWSRARTRRHTMLTLPRRIATAESGQLQFTCVDLKSQPRNNGLTEPVRYALQATFERGQQSLVFINRRGYAPVLACDACGWLSSCPRCTAYAAFHRVDNVLRCHHCGWTAPLPQHCPGCGNQDLSAVGAGTQRIEEHLQSLLPSARVARLDRDSASRMGAARATLEAMHTGDVDVLVGTQMLTKGHDFRRVSNVVILNVDAQLVSYDFRAAERLFSTLTQVIGRAGRAGLASSAWIETRFPGHALFAALERSDYAAFADGLLRERQRAQLPPFTFQALLTAESRTMTAAIQLLADIRTTVNPASGVTAYDPVPMTLAKRADRYRAQLLIEANHRRPLHDALRAIDVNIVRGRRPAVRLQMDVDPQAI